jgi:opacity protein-like surface antigen
MRKYILIPIVLLPLLMGTTKMRGQEEPVVPKAEIYGGYAFLRNHGNNFNGWEGQANFNFGRYFGATADFTGSYRTAASIGVSGLSVSANQRIYSYLFGPRVTARFGKHAIFGHALFGGAHSSLGAGVSLPVLGGFSTGVNSANAFAMAFGGGADLGVSNHVAIRPAQIDYLYTHFNSLDALTTGLTSTTTNHQNSFRYSGGLVFRF